MNDLKLIKDIEILYRQEVYLWGAGKIGKESIVFLSGAGINMAGFCDNNKQLTGNCIGAYKVYSTEEMENIIKCNKNIAIVITSNYLEQIHQQLADMGMDLDYVFSKFALYYSLFRNIDCEMIPDNYRQIFKTRYRRWKIINHKRADYRFSFKYYAYNWDKIVQKNPIVIYQPGKVASVTLLNSILACGQEVVQTHALAFRSEFMDNEMKSLYLDFQNAIRSEQSIRIISGVREPIQRDISYLFEHINLPFVEIYDKFNNDLLLNIQDCLNNYFVTKSDGFSHMSPTLIHHMIRVNGGIFQWFERELEEVYHINILDYPFDRDKGYSIIKKGNIELLIYKVEKLNELEKDIGNFLGIDEFKFKNSNLSKNRDYRYTYKQVLDEIQLSENYIDMYYNNQYMNHFYTEKERDIFLKKWVRSYKGGC